MKWLTQHSVTRLLINPIFMLSIISSFLYITTASAADNPPPPQQQSPYPTQPSTQSTIPTQPQPALPPTEATPATITVYCPDAASLVKDPKKLTWATPDNQWQSFDISFEKKLTQFIGAQWHGVGLGQIFCLYRGEDKDSFPVLLAFHALALVPRSDSWGTDMGGYRNCTTDKQSECGFEVRTRPQQVDIYDQALKLKTQPGS